ncbi:Gmad2 immunoglobulin-like domain-containing protein [Patescibacteria group bacterium]|nr:Gmad2 immunoglobulin-like domain-containing protein [Patescibacteria group bacterium]
MKSKAVPILIITVVVVAIIIAVVVVIVETNKNTNTTTSNTNTTTNTNATASGGGPIISFADCEDMGFPVAESYPRQCTTPEGETFTENIGNELEKIDLITISTPRPNDVLTSPIIITGQARGTWFCEGSFAIQLKDVLGVEIGTAIATSSSDWMTEDFIPFEATLTFTEPAYGPGNLYLNKSNPSDNIDLSDQLIVPVDLPLN